MAVFLPTQYDIVNANAFEVSLDVAGHRVQVPASTTIKLQSPNRVIELPSIKGVTITPTDLPEVYIPFGGFLIEAEVIGAGDTSATTFSGTLANADIDRGSVSIRDTSVVETFTDPKGDGVLVGDQSGTGTIDYRSGEFSVTFNAAPASENILADYLHRENKRVRP